MKLEIHAYSYEPKTIEVHDNATDLEIIRTVRNKANHKSNYNDWVGFVVG